MFETCLRRDVGEFAVVSIAIEFARMTFTGLDIGDGGSIHEVDVHPTIVVEVKDCDASAHGVHDVLLVDGSTGQMEVNLRSASDIGEARHFSSGLCCSWPFSRHLR